MWFPLVTVVVSSLAASQPGVVPQPLADLDRAPAFRLPFLRPAAEPSWPERPRPPLSAALIRSGS
ncbi:MAG: hypothetical protein ABSA53_17625 [Streptosporangiaceae bacterium]